MPIDIGNPIKIGCKPKGCPKTCQMTAVSSPPHMEASPASFVTLFQNSPNKTGASNPETDMAVPVTMRFTNPGIAKENTRAITDTINTEILL